MKNEDLAMEALALYAAWPVFFYTLRVQAVLMVLGFGYPKPSTLNPKPNVYGFGYPTPKS